jgi:SynChlorMet cassette protein ScmC
LSQRGWIARLLPRRLRPRVVVFLVRGRDQAQLLLGKRIIGRYDEQRRKWQIQRPFQLFVDSRVLAGYGAEVGMNRQVLTEWQRAVDHLQVQGVQYELTLTDGSRWGIAAGDGEAAAIVSQLGQAMRLRPVADAVGPSAQGDLCRLLVRVDAHTSVADCYVPLAAKKGGVVLCVLSPSDHWGGPYVNLVRLSLVLAREAQARGGVLLHGALAELGGSGVILVAPGGTGKTTASNRLPSPWTSLCDDTTLLVRDAQGIYRAHPWPTWSRFLANGPGGSWDVQSAVPVKGIFVLAQATADRVERVGAGQAVSLLGEFVEQASWFMAPGLSKGELDALHLERFNNLCALARIVPAHVLHISLNGTFWTNIEQALQGGPGADN